MKDLGLLILDMQCGNFEEPDPIYNGTELLTKVLNLVNKARTHQIPIIYVQNNGGEGDPDSYGTPGWQIHPTITPRTGDIIIQKQSPDSFHQTDLHNKLRGLAIQKLIITGLQTEYCIDTSCSRAYSLGYDIILVKDGHSTWDSDQLTAKQIITHHNDVLGGWFVKVVAENEITFNNS